LGGHGTSQVRGGQGAKTHGDGTKKMLGFFKRGKKVLVEKSKILKETKHGTELYGTGFGNRAPMGFKANPTTKGCHR